MNGIVTVCVCLGTIRTGSLFLSYLEVEHTGSSQRHRDFPHSQTVSNFLVRSDPPLEGYRGLVWLELYRTASTNSFDIVNNPGRSNDDGKDTWLAHLPSIEKILFGTCILTQVFSSYLIDQRCLPVPIFAGHTDFGPQSRFPDFMRWCTDFGRCGNF